MAISFLPADTVPYVSTFLFVFAVVFGLLSYAKVFVKDDKPDRRINGAIALAIALFSIAYPPLVKGLTLYMPLAIAVLIPLFFIVFVKKVIEEDKGKQATDTFPLIVSLIILGMLVYVFEDQIRLLVPLGIDPSAFIWLGGITVSLLFFWLVYKSKKD
jgi:hypothetical protein